MKVSKLLALGLVLGLSMSAARAQLTHVVINLNLVVQADSIDDGTTTKTPAPAKFHVGNKEILSRVATDHGTNYPTGAKLAINNDQFLVVDASDNILDTVPELTFTTSDSRVRSGSVNDANESGNQTSIRIATLSFDDTGDSPSIPVQFTASGVFTDKTIITKPGTGGQTQTDTAIATVAGNGTVSGKNAIVTGTVAGKRTGPFTPVS